MHLQLLTCYWVETGQVNPCESYLTKHVNFLPGSRAMVRLPTPASFLRSFMAPSTATPNRVQISCRGWLELCGEDQAWQGTQTKHHTADKISLYFRQ
jgi:hypothetical protein